MINEKSTLSRIANSTAIARSTPGLIAFPDGTALPKINLPSEEELAIEQRMDKVIDQAFHLISNS